MQKIGLLLLGALLIVQFANSLPTPDDNAVAKGTEGREKLLHDAQEIYVDFFRYSAEKYRDLFKKVLETLKPAAESDPKVKEQLKRFEDFVAETEDVTDKTKEELHELFNISTQITANRSDDDDDEADDKVDARIAELLMDSEAMKVKFDVLMHYVTALDKFGNNVRRYLNSLTEEERQDNMKIDRWYEDWRHEHDFEKRTEILIKFFDTFDPTDEFRDKAILNIIKYCLFYLDDVISKRGNVYGEIAEAIDKEIENPNENIEFQRDVLKRFHDRAEKVHSLEGKDAVLELIRLYFANKEIVKKYRGSDLSEDEQKVAKILEKENDPRAEAAEIILTYGFTNSVIEEVEDYLSSLNKSEKETEKKLSAWLEEVQDETDYGKKTSKVISILDVLRKDD